MQVTLCRDRLIRYMKQQAEIGGTSGGGLNRLALTDEDLQVREWLRTRMDPLSIPAPQR